MTAKSSLQSINDQQGSQRHRRILPQEVTNLVAGGIAGMFAKTAVAPMDRIKILYQVTSTPFHIRHVPSVVGRIVKEEGFYALWKGNTVSMIRVVPYAGIQFMVFNKCKSYLLSLHKEEEEVTVTPIRGGGRGGGRGDGGKHNSHNNFKAQSKRDRKWDLTPVESLAAGSTAGALSVIFTYPLDLTRAQLAVMKSHKGKKNVGFIGVLFGNYSKGGFLGLFRGITPTLMGILPYSGLAFSINEQTKRQIVKINKRDPSTIEKAQCGAISGLFAQSITYPLEVTRRRMQTIGVVPTSGSEAAVGALGDMTSHQKEKVVKLSKPNPPTLTQVVKDVWKGQGMNGFFKGLSMNWLKGPIAFSISFTTFDILKEFIENEEERWLSTYK